MDETMAELLPCPFCDDVKEVRVTGRWPRSGFEVFCDNCISSGPMAFTEAEAAERWNARSHTPQEK